MSGLFGVLDFSGARGPAGPCRLAFLEPSGGLQPVRSPDSAVHVVADLRLDNRRELIARLTDDGVPVPESPRDADLLLAAYLRWGEECPLHLLGDFAFVLWDSRRRRLVAACDPVGIKTLHHARIGSLLCLASEARQVLQHPAVPCRLDEGGVADYLLDGTEDPARTLFLDVRRLLPGHCLVATSGGERIARYWSLDPDARTVYRRDEDYAAHFLDLFTRAVNDRLRTESGSVGILMSGGLDSSSVAAAARRRLPAARGLFAVSFLFERLRECDEREFIQAAADGLGLERETVLAERFPVLDPEACRPSLESPSLAWDRCFQEALRRTRSRGARVLLTGHGGDDLMLGSYLVYADRLRRGDPRAVLEVARYAMAQGRDHGRILYRYLVQPLLPGRADQALRRLLGRAPGAELPGWIDAGFARRNGLAGRIQDEPRSAREALYGHFRQTPWDRAAHWYNQHAAAFGIEVRHPFLDRRLVEFILSIPPQKLFRAGLSKPLLRQAMTGVLPETVRMRKDKTRLGAFLSLSAGSGTRSRIESLLAAPLAAELGIFDADHLRAAWRRSQEGKLGELDGLLWYSISLEIWLREHGACLGLAPPVASQPAA